jgi:hypothetical protein
VPLTGETIEDDDLNLNVLSVDGQRIRKVHVIRKREHDDEPPDENAGNGSRQKPDEIPADEKPGNIIKMTALQKGSMLWPINPLNAVTGCRRQPAGLRPYSLRRRSGANVRGGCSRLQCGNASYAVTICAERTALVKAVSEGYRQFDAIAVVTRNGGSPCGICRRCLNSRRICAPHADMVGHRQVCRCVSARARRPL